MESVVNSLLDRLERAQAQLDQAQARVKELESLVRQYPEWLTWGVWDTDRCLVCKGFRHASGTREAGHRPGCPRAEFEDSAPAPEPKPKRARTQASAPAGDKREFIHE